MHRLSSALAAVTLVGGLARAQPVTEPAPLAQIRDEKQLAEALAAITQDPAIPVDEPAIRALDGPSNVGASKPRTEGHCSASAPTLSS